MISGGVVRRDSQQQQLAHNNDVMMSDDVSDEEDLESVLRSIRLARPHQQRRRRMSEVLIGNETGSDEKATRLGMTFNYFQ